MTAPSSHMMSSSTPRERSSSAVLAAQRAQTGRAGGRQQLALVSKQDQRRHTPPPDRAAGPGHPPAPAPPVTSSSCPNANMSVRCGCQPWSSSAVAASSNAITVTLTSWVWFREGGGVQWRGRQSPVALQGGARTRGTAEQAGRMDGRQGGVGVLDSPWLPCPTHSRLQSPRQRAGASSPASQRSQEEGRLRVAGLSSIRGRWLPRLQAAHTLPALRGCQHASRACEGQRSAPSGFLGARAPHPGD